MLGFLRLGTAEPGVGSALQGSAPPHATMRVPTYPMAAPCGLPSS